MTAKTKHSIHMTDLKLLTGKRESAHMQSTMELQSTLTTKRMGTSTMMKKNIYPNLFRKISNTMKNQVMSLTSIHMNMQCKDMKNTRQLMQTQQRFILIINKNNLFIKNKLIIQNNLMHQTSQLMQSQQRNNLQNKKNTSQKLQTQQSSMQRHTTRMPVITRSYIHT